ncbi:MAG: alpha/beta hydrolase [Pirellulaceae bacterium]|nr:alpha/beta hydrolase [Pirellulaceae bacterium]
MFATLRQYFGGSISYGERPPLVLINGLAEQGESWFRSVDYWRKWFDVHLPGILVYDGPVMQRRLASGQPVSVDFLADRLEQYLDEFVQRPPYRLVASSLGGQVAVEYTSRHPEKVAGLVLICPSGMGSEEKLPITEGARHKDYQGLVGSVFHNRRLVPPAVVDYYARKFNHKPWRKALFQTVRGTKRHSVRDKLRRIERPTLVICGREDQIVDPLVVESAVAGIPSMKFVMLDQCGHAPQLEMPGVVNPLVARFLRAEHLPLAPIAPEPALAIEG